MPKINEVSNLIREIGRKNFDIARVVVEQMISNEIRNGRENAAEHLKKALMEWGDNNSKLVELPRNLQSLLYCPVQEKRFSNIYLSEQIKQAIEYFIIERESAKAIKEAGLPTRNRILLAGPPGNGKTSLSISIGGILNIPVYIGKLSEVIDSYMGRTSKNLSSIFEYIQNNRCILFLDELDALGQSRRSAESGADREYSLITNTLLMTLDRVPDTTIIIGATNMPEILDSALLRRFNLKIWLDNPGEEDIQKYVSDYQVSNDVDFLLSEEEISKQLLGQSWSRVEDFCISRHRSVILNNFKNISNCDKWIGREVR